MRTAPARASAENFFAFVIAQSSQRNEPPQDPGRFSCGDGGSMQTRPNVGGGGENRSHQRCTQDHPPSSDEFNPHLLQPDQTNVRLIDLHPGNRRQEIGLREAGIASVHEAHQ